jgi:hypothetical protein
MEAEKLLSKLKFIKNNFRSTIFKEDLAYQQFLKYLRGSIGATNCGAPCKIDLTPLDYFLWGHLKTVVYANPPTNLIVLKQKIIAACNQLTKGQISSATKKRISTEDRIVFKL